MANGSLKLAEIFSCGLDRVDPVAAPENVDNALLSLRRVVPPVELATVHSSDHLVSFARHVQRLLAGPVEVLDVDGDRLVHVLGQAVLVRKPTGTFQLNVWLRPSGGAPCALHAVEVDHTPFLDFPRTTLWTDNLRDMLRREARARVADATLADRWAGWAWSWIVFKVVGRADIRRLRSRIRGALDLDPVVLRLLRHRRQYAVGARWLLGDYNAERATRDRTLLLEREAPALLPLWWALRTHPSLDRSLEPKKALRLLARSLGVTPQQWKQVAQAGHAGARLYRALCREFFHGDERANALEFLALIRLLRPRRMPSLELWRQFLSLSATRQNPAEINHAETLGSHQESLRHVLRLAEASMEAGGAPWPPAQLHLVLAWIADRGITRFTRSQRAAGRELLVRRAEQHRAVAMQAPDPAPTSWKPLLRGFDLGQFRVVPLDSAAKVWDEAVAMRHCADRFIERCARSECALFSLQRHCGKRVATLALARRDGSWRLLELAGKANSEPSGEVWQVARRVCERAAAIAFTQESQA